MRRTGRAFSLATLATATFAQGDDNRAMATHAFDATKVELGSCHTAFVASDAVEGHVPADDVVEKMLAMKPLAVGIAVPALAVGLPGMELGSRKAPYQVLLVDAQGRERVFSSSN